MFYDLFCLNKNARYVPHNLVNTVTNLLTTKVLKKKHSCVLFFCKTELNILSQPIKIGPLVTDSLKQIKETFGQFLTELPRFLLNYVFWRITKTL